MLSLGIVVIAIATIVLVVSAVASTNPYRHYVYCWSDDKYVGYLLSCVFGLKLSLEYSFVMV